MRMPSRRALAHAAGALALAATAVVTLGSPSRADGVLKPEIFSGRAVASSFHFFFNRTPGLFPLDDIFHVEVPYSTSVINSSGTIQADSASIYPGGGVLGGPGLICGQLAKCPFTVPTYPLIAHASYPTTPDASAETSLGSQSLGGILKADPSIITAHADPDSVDAKTTAVTLGLLDAATADTVSTRAMQYFKNGALVTTAQSDVAGVDVLGGLLHIDAISSIATSTVGGGNKPSGSVTTKVTGATLAGQPVVIDETGIHLGPSGDGGAVGNAINSLLASLADQGVVIKLAGASKDVTKNGVNASTSGLFISFAHSLKDIPLPIPPLPLPVALPGTGGDYEGSISIGGAGISTFANGQTVVDTNPGSGTNPPIVSGNDVLPDLGGSSDPSLGNPGEAIGPGTITESPEGPVVQPLTNAVAPLDLTNKRLKTLALALIAYPALVLLWRLLAPLAGGALRAPSRLPKA